MQGRDFSRDFASDREGVVVNESAVEMMRLQNPVGELLIKNRNGQRTEYKILGVIRDVVKGSPFERTDPCLYFLSGNSLGWLHIRMNNRVTAMEALPKIEAVFKQLVPSAPFDYTFADDDYQAKFKSEVRMSTLATIFTFLTILISCLGLFGLSSFIAEQRTKELGIRKVMGASVISLWQMLSRDFVLLVVLSCLIAIPLSFSFMSNWLEHYEYRTEIPGYVFVLASTGALLVTLLTVSYQAVKAALMNPVKSLRSE
jgi:putative ABC transport system permease protein